MNTFEFNKVFGALTAALLVYLLAGFVAEQVYHVAEPEEPAYAIAIADAAPAAEAEPEEDLATLLAAADPANGATVFRKCAACHKLEDGANGVGPHLHAVVGRDVGSVAGYNYSGALSAAASVWGFEELNAFLTNPKGYAPGTSMGFAGLTRPEERAAVIVYLNTEGGSNLPLPEPAAAEPEAAPAEEQAAVEEQAPAEEQPAPQEQAAAEPAPPAEAAPETADEQAPAETLTAEAAPEAAPVDPAAEAQAALAAAIETASVSRGSEVFANACALCHTTDEGRHGIGPSLHGVIGADIASAARFPYSAAFASVEGSWTATSLDAYMTDPSGFIGGERIGFRGIEDAGDRAAVIAFLNAEASPRGPLFPADDASAAAGEDAAAPAGDGAEQQAAAQTAPAPTGAQDQIAEEEAAAPVEDPAPVETEAAERTPGNEGETVAAAAPEADAQAAEEQAGAEAAPAADTVAEAAPAAERAPEPAAEAAPASGGSEDPFVAAYKAATADDGAKLFRRCAACHKLAEGANGVGPSLHGVVGRPVDSVAGYSYSGALEKVADVWSFENLNAFLENPRAYAPGTKMAFAGLRKLEERAAVIRYLNEEGGSNLPIE